MSLPNHQEGSLFEDIDHRPDSPSSMSVDRQPHIHGPSENMLFSGLRQISVDTVVSTPPALPFTNYDPHISSDHQAFRYLQQLRAAAVTGAGPCALPTECHKDGSLFSIHSAPPVPLTDHHRRESIDSVNLDPTSSTEHHYPTQSRPVSLALDPNAMLTVQFSAPVVAAHSSSAVDVPLTVPSDDAEDAENENMWTVSSLTARPLIAKSKELRNIRFIGKSKSAGRTKRNGGSGGGGGCGSSGKADDGTSVGGLSKGSDYTALDGGYGWLVVFGAFSVQFWVTGLVKSYGVLYVEILENFPQASAAVASWIPAILSALCLVLAPVSSALSQRFSCRLVVFIGGIFCALGLALSYFATNLVHLFFTFGVLTGIGGGLSTTPGIIIVSQYFDKRRALANGLCVSGTAAGSFVFPMLIDRLVQSFGFHGTILTLGVCMLHVCASALLYRPPNFDPDNATDEGDSSSTRCNLRSADTTQTLVSQNSSVLGTYLSASAEEPLNTCPGSGVPGKRIFIENLFLEEAKSRLDELCQNNKLDTEVVKNDQPSDDEEKDCVGETLVMKPFSKCTRSSSVYLHSVEDLSTDSTFVYKKRGSGHESNRGSRKRNKPTAEDGSKSRCNSEKKNSIPRVITEDDRQDQCKMNDFLVPNENKMPAPINRGLSKSMMIIPTPVSELIPDEDELDHLNKLNGDCGEEDGDEGEKSSNPCMDWINNYLDLSLLSDPMFILMCLSVTLMSTGSPYMLYYLPAYVLSAGYTKAEAGYLVAVSAALDLTGRLGFGYLSDLQLFDRRKAFVVCVFGAGSAVLLLSVAEASFYSLATAAGVYGFCVGSWYLLMPVILADVFGMERISSSYGLIRMFQGVGAVSVPPLSGFMRDQTGSYDVCFYAMGACMMIGSIPMIVSIAIDPSTDAGDGDEDGMQASKKGKASP